MFFRAIDPIAPAIELQADGPMPEAAEEEVAEMMEHLRAAIESPLVSEAEGSPLFLFPVLGPDEWAAEELGPALNVDLLLPE